MISQDFLQNIPIFEKLSPADFEVLVKLWKPRKLRKSGVLFRYGETGTSMVVIEEGTIEISVPIENEKKEMQISVLHEGEFVGELALIDGLPRTATARALESSRVHEMKRDDFVQFLLERPAVAISMMSEMGKRLRATNELVQSLASKNVNEEIEERLTFGERLADKIAEFGGSWTFITGFMLLLGLWMLVNSLQLWFRPFDEFPFIFLNLMLSCLAALQAPIIMMSQNRAQKKDRLKAELDYQVNLKSELMIQQLHVKFDELRANEIHDIHAAIDARIRALLNNPEGVRNSGRSQP
ncbi:MAG: DUF1003 domain-containing protein [Ignavibacteriales bacterium]|nr:DUF1003 domain-containing protein [Ignavibacteriales bacterium]